MGCGSSAQAKVAVEPMKSTPQASASPVKESQAEVIQKPVQAPPPAPSNQPQAVENAKSPPSNGTNHRPNMDVADEEAAAVKIQARARGMSDRKLVGAKKEAGQLPGQSRTQSGDTDAAVPMSTAAEDKVEVNTVMGEEEAALKIQARARGVADRKRVEELKGSGSLPGQGRQTPGDVGGTGMEASADITELLGAAGSVLGALDASEQMAILQAVTDSDGPLAREIRRVSLIQGSMGEEQLEAPTGPAEGASATPFNSIMPGAETAAQTPFDPLAGLSEKLAGVAEGEGGVGMESAAAFDPLADDGLGGLGEDPIPLVDEAAAPREGGLDPLGNDALTGALAEKVPAATADGRAPPADAEG